MASAEPIRVLFVCTGNICRSPTAEGVFRHRVRQAGLEHRILVDSAGTHGYHIGEAPDPRTVRCARARGIDLSDLRARRISPRDFQDFSLILAMDRGHYAALGRMAPGAAARIALFLDYAPGGAGRDVPDPYYGEAADFDTVFALVEAGADGLLAALRHQLD